MHTGWEKKFGEELGEMKGELQSKYIEKIPILNKKKKRNVYLSNTIIYSLA